MTPGGVTERGASDDVLGICSRSLVSKPMDPTVFNTTQIRPTDHGYNWSFEKTKIGQHRETHTR